MTRPVLVVCMGVSGCGTTTVARHVADGLGLAFLEADDFHSPENRERMASGLPLDDAMRAPWIEAICLALRDASERGASCVLACSALRRPHRQQLRETGMATNFLFLDGSRERIARWIGKRDGHFMPPGLLDSQFDALESPLDEPDVTRIGIDRPWLEVAADCLLVARRLVRANGLPG